MKKLKSVVAVGFIVISANCGFLMGGTIKPDEKKYLESYGWVVGSQSQMVQLGLTGAELEVVIDGFRKSAQGEKSPSNLQEMSSGMQQYFQDKAESYQAVREKQLEKESVENKKGADELFSELERNSKVKKTDSGLFYQVIKKGDSKNNMPNEKSVVKIDYVGTLVNGEVFDSSKERGEPVVFSLGRVIPGFREGLQLVGKGGTIKLYIPPELAYGNQDLPGIPPGSTLIFEVDMLDIVSLEEADQV